MAPLSLELDQRGGWPEALRALLDRYPRSQWRAHDSAGARFWLAVHDGFREECAALGALTDDFTRGRIDAAALAARAAPRLRGMVAHLQGHHEIEEHHYFPAFRSATPSLAEGFDALGRDHAQLLLDVDLALSAAADLMTVAASPGRDPHAARHGAETFVRTAQRLCRHLEQHLADEEDLVIPLLLSRPDL
jgi:hypothetical protein